jgi:hypothetical protein
MVTHLQEEYYSSKEERQSKKMRVTLKDIKNRKSIGESEAGYSSKGQDETKESLTRELLIRSLKKDVIRS